MKRTGWLASAVATWCLATFVAACLPARAIVLHATRQSAADLEVGGSLAGVPKGETRFVRYDELLALPQVTYSVSDDTNFGRTVTISGVPLEKLPALVGAKPGASMAIAICDDFYAAHYPEQYLKEHHPVLVLRVNGEAPAQWPLGVDGEAMGPYVISHSHFAPGFKVLSHTDEAQVPWGVVRIDFRVESEVYAPIRGRIQDQQSQAGYTIARQNCFRCHARQGEGGTKSKVGWDAIARHAARDPEEFATYVRDPKKANPASQMAPSPQYDDETMRALRRYFEPFAGDAR